MSANDADLFPPRLVAEVFSVFQYLLADKLGPEYEADYHGLHDMGAVAVAGSVLDWLPAGRMPTPDDRTGSFEHVADYSPCFSSDPVDDLLDLIGVTAMKSAEEVAGWIAARGPGRFLVGFRLQPLSDRRISLRVVVRPEPSDF